MLANPEEMFRSLSAIGLPAPVAVKALGRSPLKTTLGLSFPEGARLGAGVMKVYHADPGWGGPAAERAALRAMHLFSELPVPREFAIINPGIDGDACTLSSWLPGEPGTTLMARGGRAAEVAARQTGRVLQALEEVFQPGFASRATLDGELLPRRSTWRGECEALLEGWILQSERGGADLGPRSARLAAMCRADAPALDTAWTWSLVHGDLQPGNLLLDPADGALRGVVGWERAMAGDPLIDWAIILSLPEPTLARVLEGYGRDRASELLDPDTLARLGFYWRARCLQRLAMAALPALGVNQGRPRALTLELARALAEEATGEDAVRERLDRALGGSARAVEAWARPPAPALLCRRALETARLGEHLGADAIRVASALACAESAALLGSGAAALPHLMAGERLLPGVAAGAAPLPCPTLGDRGRWQAALVNRALTELEQSGAPGPCGAITLLALVSLARQRLGDAISDATLSGIELLFSGLLTRERGARSREMGPGERILHAWAGSFALRVLGQAQPGLQHGLARQARDGWGALAAQVAGVEDEGLELLERLPAEGSIDPLLPIVLLAHASGVRPPGIEAPSLAVLSALRLVEAPGAAAC